MTDCCVNKCHDEAVTTPATEISFWRAVTTLMTALQTVTFFIAVTSVTAVTFVSSEGALVAVPPYDYPATF